MVAAGNCQSTSHPQFRCTSQAHNSHITVGGHLRWGPVKPFFSTILTNMPHMLLLEGRYGISFSELKVWFSWSVGVSWSMIYFCNCPCHRFDDPICVKDVWLSCKNILYSIFIQYMSQKTHVTKTINAHTKIKKIQTYHCNAPVHSSATTTQCQPLFQL